MYDYLFITHLPAFYKVNLYNQLAERLRIFVVFVASASRIRTDDFVGKELNFEHEILHRGDFESRPLLRNGIRLLNIISRLEYRKLVVSGWDLAEFWIAVLTSDKKKNAVVVESTIAESATFGVKSRIKKLFLSRVRTAFPSGLMQQQLLTALNFDGQTFLTGGVGIIEHGEHQKHSREAGLEFLYVGRLAREKNVGLLVEAFNELPHLRLTIVGSGPLEEEIKKAAKSNIRFRSHVSNREIGSVYLDHDFLVLPSLREPWGLVVEEALSYGLPVIVSKNVGCYTELVGEELTGTTFDPQRKEDLKDAIVRASSPEASRRMRAKIAVLNFKRRAEDQLVAFERASRN